MVFQQIKQVYKHIFRSYDEPYLEKHIEKIIELDNFLPYSSTFFCITNTQDLTFEYISKNMTACLGLDINQLKAQGMRSLWSRMHPDDIEHWLKALNELMNFTLKEIDEKDRTRMSYTWNYRLKNLEEKYLSQIKQYLPQVIFLKLILNRLAMIEKINPF